MRDGNICLDNSNLCFYQYLAEKDFLLSDPGKSAKLLIDNAGYHTYLLSADKVKGTLFSFLAVFYNGVLQSVALTNCEDAGQSSYQESELITLKQKHDGWLISAIGASGPYRFNWGSIESVYDKKSWSASIVFRYL
jgi:hypothetical protein